VRSRGTGSRPSCQKPWTHISRSVVARDAHRLCTAASAPDLCTQHKCVCMCQRSVLVVSKATDNSQTCLCVDRSTALGMQATPTCCMLMALAAICPGACTAGVHGLFIATRVLATCCNHNFLYKVPAMGGKFAFELGCVNPHQAVANCPSLMLSCLPWSAHTSAPCLISQNFRTAMSIVSSAFRLL
jgi:hypothetical protein